MDEPREVPNEGGPVLFVLNAFGTRYRGAAIALGQPAEALFGTGAHWLVAVEPAGGRQNVNPARMWHTFPWSFGPLTQSYIEEKFAVQGEDAVAITVLVAAMLSRQPVLVGEWPEAEV